jgi:HlyD family secretion protein
MKRVVTTIIVLVLLGVGGFFAYRYYQSQQAAQAGDYQTVAVTRGDLTATVGATGVVRTNQTAVLSWQINGQIGLLDVEVGDTVRADQVLAELAQSSLSQSLILARADLVTAKRNLDTLLNSDIARAQALQNLVTAQQEMDDAQKNRLRKDFARSDQDQVDVAKANLVLAEDEVKKAEETYNVFVNAAESDPQRAAALSRLANARDKRDRAQSSLDWLLGKPGVLEVSEADARIEVATARLKDAQREWTRLKDGPDPDDIAAAEARIAAIEATLNQVNLKAPFAGTLTEVRSHAGDQVNPGTASFRLDDLSRLLVDVQVTEVDINRVKMGQVVTLTFDAITDRDYSGKVVEVAAVGTAVQGVVNFTVTIELSDVDELVRPGMTAAVNIVTETVENVLLVPNRAVRLREGQRVVYVLEAGEPVAREITLGLTSDQYSEILDGDLTAGALLVLNPPAEFQFGPPGMGR